MVVLSLIAQHIFELIHQQQQIPIFALELWKEVEKQEERRNIGVKISPQFGKPRTKHFSELTSFTRDNFPSTF